MYAYAPNKQTSFQPFCYARQLELKETCTMRTPLHEMRQKMNLTQICATVTLRLYVHTLRIRSPHISLGPWRSGVGLKQ